MQLGTRWPFGTTPPASVPAETRARVAALEATRADGAGRTWTLTWLEGRPRCALDDVALLTLDHADRAILVEPVSGPAEADASDDDDDWLN